MKQKGIDPSPMFEGIEAARFSAAMFFQSQLPQTENAAPVYLDKNDPVVKSIKGQALTDLRGSTKYMDPESAENILIGEQVKEWSQKKKNQLQVLGGQSMAEYTVQTLFDTSTFMLVYASFKEMDAHNIPADWDIRVQRLGSDNYLAEFWEDSHIAQPEAKNDIGENDRYYKMIVLLYTIEKDGSVNFHEPFQPVLDFLKN